MNKVEKIKKLADAMYNRMQNLTTDTSGIRKAMDEYHQFIINEYYKENTEKDFGIKTKFKVGDTIRNKQWPTACHTIESIDSESYYLDNGGKVEIAHQDLWELEEEPISNDLEEAAKKIATRHSHITGDTYYANDAWFFKKGAQWQKKQDQSTIELAEDHAYLAGQEKIIAKACDWLENYFKGVSSGTVYLQDFKKAIKE